MKKFSSQIDDENGTSVHVHLITDNGESIVEIDKNHTNGVHMMKVSRLTLEEFLAAESYPCDGIVGNIVENNAVSFNAIKAHYDSEH